MRLHSPTCVGLRYGRPGEQSKTFLGKLSGDTLRPEAKLSIRLPSPFSLCVTLSCLNPSRCRNINLLGIDYALRPRLSSRLTLGGRTFPRKPWAYGDMDFNHVYRYLCLHSHFQPLHLALPLGFTATGTLSYSSRLRAKPQLR